MSRALVGDGVPYGVVEGEGAAADLREQRRLIFVIERRVAAQQDEQHHARAPQVHRRPIYQPGRPLRTIILY